jgi:DNA helicase HerA-like ATPase
LTGSSGAGKSYGLRVIAERLIPICQTVIVDPDGEFATLREKFPVVILGDPMDGADVAASTKTAAQTATIIYQSRLSVVCDLYGVGQAEQATWIAAFLDSIMAQPRETWHRLVVLVDEAHRFVNRGNRKSPSCAAITHLMDAGRKHHIGTMLATQRISKLDTDARAEAENRMVGMTMEDIDRDRGAEMIGLPRAERFLIQTLQPGDFFCLGPAITPRNLSRFRFDQAATSHPNDMDEEAPTRVLPPPSPDLAQTIRSLWHLQQ